MDSVNYCQQLATPPGSNLYYALLFYEPAIRRKLLCLFALQLELQRTIENCQDPGVARMKLQWWLEEIERLYKEQPRHPVSKLLAEVGLKNQLEQHQLRELVGLAEHNINPAINNSIRDLLDNCCRYQAPAWQLASSVLGQDGDERLAILAGLYTSVERLKNALSILNKGYCIFPADLMQKADLDADALRYEPATEKNANLLKELFTELESELGKNLPKLSDNCPPPPLFALSLAGIARANCTLLKKQKDLRELPASSITPLRKLWISWLTQRRHRRAS